MPTYTYRCKSCKLQWEEILKVVDIDKPLSEDCPACDEGPIIRLMPTVAKRASVAKNDFDANLMDPTVKKRLEKIKNTKGIEKSTSKISWGD